MRSSAVPLFVLLLACSSVALSLAQLDPQPPKPAAAQVFVGFDRNEYPGDAALNVLRKSYSFTSYWLSPPPGATVNTWVGRRAALKAKGFGFLLLYLGKSSAQIQTNKIAVDAGLADAHDAAAAARREGIAQGSVIFLDQEEGGRYSSGQHLYLRTWAEELEKEHFRPGIYCSGIAVDEGEGLSVITADDIREHIGVPDVVFWVYNDACPPSPGCTIPQNALPPSASGVGYASVWQFVRSPREKKIARHCRGYAKDGNCYAPGDTRHQWFLDANVAITRDPSAPR